MTEGEGWFAMTLLDRSMKSAKAIVASIAAVSFPFYGYAFQRAWNSLNTGLIIPFCNDDYLLLSCSARSIVAMILVALSLRFGAKPLRHIALVGGVACQFASLSLLLVAFAGAYDPRSVGYLLIALESLATMLLGALWLDLYSSLNPMRASILLATVFILGRLISYSLEQASPPRLVEVLCLLALASALCAWAATRRSPCLSERKPAKERRLFPHRAAVFFAACALAYGAASSMHPAPAALASPILAPAAVLLVALANRHRFSLPLFVWISLPFIICGFLFTLLLPNLFSSFSFALLDNGYGAVRMLLFLLICLIAHSSSTTTYWLFGILSFIQMAFQAAGMWIGAYSGIGQEPAMEALACIAMLLGVVLASVLMMARKGVYSLIDLNPSPAASPGGGSAAGAPPSSRARKVDPRDDDAVAVRAENLITSYELTQRESEVLRMAVQGKSNEEIANDLFVSIGTVKAHLYHIYKKMGIHTRKELFDMVGIDGR